MKIGFNGASTMKADLSTDIRVASQAGYDLVEIWAKKLEAYLSDHSLDDLRKLLEKAQLNRWRSTLSSSSPSTPHGKKRTQ